MLQSVAAWKTELAARFSSRANSELSWGDSACWTDWTKSCPEHDEPGRGGVERRLGGGGQGSHQHDVGALQRGLGDPGDRSRATV